MNVAQLVQPGWAGVTLVGNVEQYMTGTPMNQDRHHHVPFHLLGPILHLFREHAGSTSLLDNVTFFQTIQVSIKYTA